MDGIGGKENIANHLGEKYEQLYNFNDISTQILQFVRDLNVKCDDISEIELVTPETVYQAIKLLWV